MFTSASTTTPRSSSEATSSARRPPSTGPSARRVTSTPSRSSTSCGDGLHRGAAARDHDDVPAVGAEQPRELDAEPARGTGDQRGRSRAGGRSSGHDLLGEDAFHRAAGAAGDAQVVVDEALARVLLVAEATGERGLLGGAREARASACRRRSISSAFFTSVQKTNASPRSRATPTRSSAWPPRADRSPRACDAIGSRDARRPRRISESSTANCTSASEPMPSLKWNFAASGGFTRSRSIRSRMRRMSATRSIVMPSGG